MSIYPPPTRIFGWQYWNAKSSQLNSGAGGSSTVDVTSAELYNLTIDSKLKAGTRYRITDYKSVNWLNGFWNADSSYPNTTGSVLTPMGKAMNPFFFNSQISGGFDGDVNVIKRSASGKYYVGGPFSSYNSLVGNGFTRINANGTKDLTFNNAWLPSGVANDIVENTDGSILVGGFFPGNIHVRKVSTTGAQIVTGFTALVYNGNVFALALQSDGKIIVGGAFTTVAGQTRNRIHRRLTDGLNDDVFSTNIGTGFNGLVRDILVLADDSMLVGGDFTSFNGVSVGRIAKLNADGTLNTAFNTNAGTGFNNIVYSITYHSLTDSYIATGAFTTYDGNAHATVIRINADGTVGSGWVGSAVFDAAVTCAAVQPDGRIIVGGLFTTIDLASIPYIGRITANGANDLLGGGCDAAVNSVIYDPITTIGVLGGAFSNFDGNPANFISSIATADTPLIDYNPLEIYTSTEEVIVMTALSENRFETEGYSETYGDIVEFLPYCNTYGLPYPNGIINGATLPDSTVVSGFDLQWDGTNAYFMMPANNPVNFGHLLYIDFSITGSPDWEFFVDPVLPGLNNTNGDSNPYNFSSSIDVSSDGMKVILNGVTEQMFLNYQPDTLYIDAVFPIAPAYGYMTRRIDLARKVDAPLDWRNIKYRRWQDITGSNDYIIMSDSGTTGNYIDYHVFDSPYSTTIQGRGGTTGYWWWNGTAENIVLFSSSYQIYFDYDYLNSVTFGNISYSFLKGGYFMYSVISNMYNNDLYLNINNSKITSLSKCNGTAELPFILANTIDAVNFQSVNISGDISASAILNNGYSKNIIFGSDTIFYVAYFDGTSMIYTAYPF